VFFASFPRFSTFSPRLLRSESIKFWANRLGRAFLASRKTCVLHWLSRLLYSARTLSLKQLPPKSVLKGLARQGVDFTDEVLISAQTDINVEGEYAAQWLLATKRAHFVFDSDTAPEPLCSFTFPETLEFRIIPVVGSGLLQARVEGVWLDLLRFSNRIKYKFDRVLKRLKEIQSGEALTPEPVDRQDPHRCPGCGLMLDFVGEVCPKCLNHGAAITRLVTMLRPYWRAAGWMALLLLFGIGLDMAWPLLTRYLVDHVLVTSFSAHQQPFAVLTRFSARELLVFIVVGLASVQIMRGIVNVITTRMASRIGNALTYDIRGKLVHKLEQLDMAYYGKQETGSLVGRVAYDTDAVQSFITQITSGFLLQFLLVIVSFVMMFSLEPGLAFWALVPAPMVIAGAFIYWRYVHPRYQRNWDRSSKQAGILHGILSGIRVVKAFAQEETEYERFQKASMALRESRQVLDRTSAFFYPLMAVVFQIGGWIIWYVGGDRVLSTQVTLGTLMAFFGYLSMFYGPLGNLTNLTTWLTQFSTQMHRIFEVLDAPTVLPDATTPATIGKGRGEIEFKNVSFSYVRGIPVLKNLNFTIRAGERIGIVGRSGSGKTSLINLICRFYDVESGQILLDGTDIRDLSKSDLRSRLAVVLQESFLFCHGALKDNISYGRPSASPEQILTASRLASAHDFIMQHTLAYDSPVGERGESLSGGERQRVSIARAILCSPQILILDEATSNIDSEAERSIQLALEKVSSGRTTIIIAHRLSTIRDCDRIFVVENGEIVEEGSHHQLLRLNQRYASWIKIQQGEKAETADAVSEEPVSARAMKTTPDDSGIRWLSRSSTELLQTPQRELQAIVKGALYRGVFALRCFPIEHKDHYLSLRFVNESNMTQEIGIIRDLNEWSRKEQKLIRDSLSRRYLFHTIQRIHSIQKVSRFLTFSASTDLGDVEFMMRHNPDSGPRIGKADKLLIDIDKNLYILPESLLLSKADRGLLERYIYW